jgi:hypothetical protein
LELEQESAAVSAEEPVLERAQDLVSVVESELQAAAPAGLRSPLAIGLLKFL